MSPVRKREAFLAMEAHASQVIESCVLPDGLNYWPILRVLYSRCFAYNDHTAYTNMMTGQGITIQHTFSLSPAILDQLQRIPEGGCAYFSRAACTVLNVQGKMFDPYLDPIAFIAQRQGIKPIKFQLATDAPLKYYIEPLGIPYEEETRATFINPQNIYAGYKDYVELCIKHNVAVIPYGGIVQSVQTIAAYRDLFVQIFSAMRPCMVILEEYYNDMSQGIALACHQCGIPCVEYQHGLQTWPHLVYHFPYIPASGYPTVPEWFFVWGNNDEERYKKYFAQQSYHKVGVAGKPDYFAWKMGRLIDDPALLENLKGKIANKKVICVPLQGPNFPVPLLDECIQQSPADWIWLLRDHPISPPVGKTFATKYPDRVETTSATALNLHTVLSLSQHMVFSQSSVAFDAIALHGLRGTTLDSLGCSYYAEPIAEGTIVYADSVPAALDAIQAGLESYPNNNPSTKYGMQSDTGVATLIKLLHLQWKEKKMQS